jgi:hypothetical protein
MYAYIIIISIFPASTEWLNLSEAITVAEAISLEADSILSVYRELKTTCDSSLLANADKNKGTQKNFHVCVCIRICMYIHMYIHR